MKYFIFAFCVFFLSCDNEKTVLLPEISTAKITEVNDVSAAYLFYDEKATDSVELNRKNLISTTNWLVNVDKRLTLEQAIPQIVFLQDKKRNAEMHKNENAKNYYTCNATSIKNLGFLDFTNVIYKMGYVIPNVTPDYQNEEGQRLILDYTKPNDIKLVAIFNDSIIKTTSLQNLKNDMASTLEDTSYELILNINKKLSFQDYISLKWALAQISSSNMTINDNEFIY